MAISQPSQTCYDISTGTTIALKRLDKSILEIWKASQNAILPISRDIAEKLKLILASVT